MDQGEFADASEEFLGAITADPKFAPGYYNLGFIAALFQDYPTAIKDYTEALTLDPTSAGAYVGRGAVYSALGALAEKRRDPNGAAAAYAQAVDDYTQSMALGPPNPLALLNRGYAYAYEHRWEEARADWQGAVQLDPKGKAGAQARGDLATLANLEAQARRGR
jgi:tetratricopeptide (TPR) repeat protein